MQLPTKVIPLVCVATCFAVFGAAVTANQLGYRQIFLFLFYFFVFSVFLSMFIIGRIVTRANREAYRRVKSGEPIFTDSLLDGNKKK